MPASPRTPTEITALLRQSTYPFLVTDLDTRTIVGANEAAYDLLGYASPSLEGVPVTEIIGSADWPNVDASMGLLASGALEAYQAQRLVRKSDGQEFTLSIWVRTVNEHGRKFGLVNFGAEDAEVPWRLGEYLVAIVGVVTDHDWVIEMVSSDIESILGISPETYKGLALLGLLQPLDAQKFLMAVARVTGDGGGATLRVHLRNSKEHWQEVLLLVVAMCRHSPPRLGLAITNPEPQTSMTSDCHDQLAARGGDVLGGVNQFRFSTPPGRFSARQGEILSRLLRGQKVQEIADDLYLSPSTVRNHLTAIYKKFAVHSHAELLAKLLAGDSGL